MALSPIEWPDIDAFLRLSKVSLTPSEIEIIEDLDDLFQSEQAMSERPPSDG